MAQMIFDCNRIYIYIYIYIYASCNVCLYPVIQTFFFSESKFVRDSTPINLIMEQMYFQKCV